MNETEQPDKPAKYSMISGPLSGWIVLWSFIVFIAAAAGQMSLIVWLPRLFPIFDDMAYLQAVIILAYWLPLALFFAWGAGEAACPPPPHAARTSGRATGSA